MPETSPSGLPYSSVNYRMPGCHRRQQDHQRFPVRGGIDFRVPSSTAAMRDSNRRCSHRHQFRYQVAHHGGYAEIAAMPAIGSFRCRQGCRMKPWHSVRLVYGRARWASCAWKKTACVLKRPGHRDRANGQSGQSGGGYAGQELLSRRCADRQGSESDYLQPKGGGSCCARTWT